MPHPAIRHGALLRFSICPTQKLLRNTQTALPKRDRSYLDHDGTAAAGHLGNWPSTYQALDQDNLKIPSLCPAQDRGASMPRIRKPRSILPQACRTPSSQSLATFRPRSLLSRCPRHRLLFPQHPTWQVINSALSISPNPPNAKPLRPPLPRPKTSLVKVQSTPSP